MTMLPQNYGPIGGAGPGGGPPIPGIGGIGASCCGGEGGPPIGAGPGSPGPGGGATGGALGGGICTPAAVKAGCSNCGKSSSFALIAKLPCTGGGGGGTGLASKF